MTLSPPPAGRSPWQRLYAAALALRRRRGLRDAERLSRPVVSVGNLHWGGGGKTPFTLALAAGLSQRRLRVTILSRGYRRASRGPLLVSRGAGPLVSWRVAGDEPFLLARALPGVAVAVGESRASAGRLALRELEPAPDLFLLDDGFSHVALARDLDLLLFPAADPFGGGKLAPGGRLREPLAAARHASAVILTAAPADHPAAGEALARALVPHGFRGPGFASATRARAPQIAAGARIVAVAGVARPEPFFASLGAFDLELAARLAFPDHHAYPDESIARIERAAQRHRAAAVVATAKDALKLEGRLRLPLVPLAIEACPEAAFWSWLEPRIAELVR